MEGNGSCASSQCEQQGVSGPSTLAALAEDFNRAPGNRAPGFPEPLGFFPTVEKLPGQDSRGHWLS